MIDDYFKFIDIQGGTFNMGSPENEEGRYDDEGIDKYGAGQWTTSSSSCGDVGAKRKSRGKRRKGDKITVVVDNAQLVA